MRGGFPKLTLLLPTFADFRAILADATAIALLSFISGILTVKSFARRSRTPFSSNQELIGFGAANIASALAQGFPVTGGSTRTAVNVSTGGMSQLAGVVAAVTMLLVLFFFTAPLAYVPNAALAAVIIMSGWGLLDLRAFRLLHTVGRLELGVSLVAMLGVLVLAVLPGVGLAVGLSLAWLIYIDSRPPDAVLGRIPGVPDNQNAAVRQRCCPTRIECCPIAKGVHGFRVYQPGGGSACTVWLLPEGEDASISQDRQRFQASVSLRDVGTLKRYLGYLGEYCSGGRCSGVTVDLCTVVEGDQESSAVPRHGLDCARYRLCVRP